jgi:hypothetical protein
MSATELDELLDRMPQIAEVVEKFSSESIQSEVFRALMRAFGLADETSGEADADPDAFVVDPPPRAGSDDTKPVKAAPAPVKKPSAKKGSGSKAKQTFTMDKTLDLVNGGTPPCKEFSDLKKPKSAVEKCLVSVYWLSRLTKTSVPATVDQVYTCFKVAGWAVPADLVNTLQQAGTKGWLDTKKRDDLKVVVQGENHVEHEMPATPKGT